jgi:hypothetical protein
MATPVYCEPYSQPLPSGYWISLSHGITQQNYNPVKDKIKVISGKSLPSGIHLQSHRKYEEFEGIRTDIVIELVDEHINISEPFGRLAKVIEQSKFFLDLEPGWDEENALTIDPEVWKTAIKFLIHYSIDIFKNIDRLIEEPEISPCKDGTIDLSWRTSRSRMLINFRKSEDGIRAYYYGDFYNNKQPIKGWVNTNTVDIYLSMWMRNLAV